MGELFTGPYAPITGIVIAAIILVGLKFLKSPPDQDNEEENIEDIVLENFDETDSLEIIAVITAALAASLNKSEDQFIIRSIKRTTSWNEAAKHERQARNR